MVVEVAMDTVQLPQAVDVGAAGAIGAAGAVGAVVAAVAVC